jgi:hypothetical protein
MKNEKLVDSIKNFLNSAFSKNLTNLKISGSQFLTSKNIQKSEIDIHFTITEDELPEYIANDSDYVIKLKSSLKEVLNKDIKFISCCWNYSCYEDENYYDISIAFKSV